MNVPIFKVEGLTVYQGSNIAVSDVSFTLLPGTDTAIVGPNGAGKSTLVQAILDLIPRTSGSIEIFGRPISRLGSLRHQIGYMPQNFIFDRSFPISVNELVGLGWIGENQVMSLRNRLWGRN
ncbi:MAG: ATP-binding cassette domain-containing protein, partial [Nostocaceae cyanobacterium]|nr:ATP-binding cassette domain-containing protein [Nostocaceae cyanobacterium]